ncbi:MAG: methionyl-tRNA formyltransferase [Gemmatimonadetes bacterium]|nr:methionyl-tRNA formyltransferase [Gemmatimonadota bacterium]
MSNRRVVLLSPGGTFADAVLALLADRGVEIAAFLLYLPGGPGEWRKAPTAGRRLLSLAGTPLRWARRRVRQRAHARAARRKGPVVLTGRLNGARMERDLRRLAPDGVVLAHCGLVARNVLQVPRDGVVNVHPGLLPWIRGNSPIGNSLVRGVPLGATAFRVDPGIDTGAILARRLVPVSGVETAGELREAVFRLWVGMTADLAADACAGRVPPGSPQHARFPLCGTLPAPEQIALIEDAVRRGEPKALFDRWAPACDPLDLSLPFDADAVLTARAAE